MNLLTKRVNGCQSELYKMLITLLLNLINILILFISLGYSAAYEILFQPMLPEIFFPFVFKKKKSLGLLFLFICKAFTYLFFLSYLNIHRLQDSFLCLFHY